MAPVLGAFNFGGTMTKYTTIQGDMWDTIAYKIYGRETYTAKLLRANKDLRDVVIFPAGVEILCPDADAETSAFLPPWK